MKYLQSAFNRINKGSFPFYFIRVKYWQVFGKLLFLGEKRKMEGFSRYVFANPLELLPLKDTEVDSPDDDILAALGFNPQDEQLYYKELSRDWNGHKAGATVILTLKQPGSFFVVENSDNQAL
jgi:hypothetical protein